METIDLLARRRRSGAGRARMSLEFLLQDSEYSIVYHCYYYYQYCYCHCFVIIIIIMIVILNICVIVMLLFVLLLLLLVVVVVVFGKGQMVSALTGSLQISCVLTERPFGYSG